jgi:hypothetical protein
MPAASCGGWRKARRPLAARATPVPFQLHRAALMLRAWDGVNPARRRIVAGILLNRNVEALRAIDWKNAPERRQLARILKPAAT